MIFGYLQSSSDNVEFRQCQFPLSKKPVEGFGGEGTYDSAVNRISFDFAFDTVDVAAFPEVSCASVVAKRHRMGVTTEAATLNGANFGPRSACA